MLFLHPCFVAGIIVYTLHLINEHAAHRYSTCLNLQNLLSETRPGHLTQDFSVLICIRECQDFILNKT